MQTVRRKNRRRFRPAYWLALPLLAVVSFLIWRFCFYSLPVPPPAKPDPIVLFKAPESSITALTVRPVKESAYTVVRDENGTYALQGEENYPLNQSLCAEMFDIMTSVVASEKVTTLGKDAKLKDFGIDEKALSVTVHNEKGTAGTWVFGSELNTEVPERFMHQEGGDTVYLTNIDYPNVLNFTKKELHVVPAVNFTKKIIGGIRIEGFDAAPFEVARENGLWKLVSPTRYPASPAKVEQLLKKITNMRLAVFESEAAPENLKAYGLDAPKARVTLKIDASVIRGADGAGRLESVQSVPAHDVVFDIGADANPVSFYCLYRGTVYKASKLSMGFIGEQAPDDFLLDKPFNLSINTIQALTVDSNGSSTHYSIEYIEKIDKNNALITDDGGRPLYDLLVQKNGASIATNEWTAFYTELTALTVSGHVPKGFTPQGDPMFTVTVEFDSGRDTAYRRTVAFYPYDALHAAVSVDGSTLHYIEREKLKCFK